MKKTFYFVSALLLIFILISLTPQKDDILWKKVDDGLYYGEYTSSKKSIFGDSKIDILKISPDKYNFNLFSAKEKGEKNRTASDWATEKKQIAVINAGMYMTDYNTNLGYMKDYNFVNNSKLGKDNTIVAFNRKNDSVPEFQIIDLKCQNWDVLKTKYNTFTQSIRMMDCNQKNKWGKQNRIWSMVVIGKDKKGNALFIFVRSPYAVHDFINILSNSSLDLYNLMYLEGGPEASFYVNHNETKINKIGSYETGFNENDNNIYPCDIPNVIGITKKTN